MASQSLFQSWPGMGVGIYVQYSVFFGDLCMHAIGS
jgi:hypothetical protein